MASGLDWLSTISSVIAAVVALVTLLTVYLAATQILSQRRMYLLGTSVESLGPWQRKVVSPSIFKMQTRISTPVVSLPKLVEKHWKPSFIFPTGFSLPSNKGVPDIEARINVMATASWVNFLQALGLGPDETTHYTMQPQPELVNGIVPMRWTGRDLVAICSILGFQSHEDRPSFKSPTPLPMQWSGPLGWLQFRASAEGCIVEFRRRALTENQLSDRLHQYYRLLMPKDPPLRLVPRLWQSINAMTLPGERVLYIGGTDRRSEMMMEQAEANRAPIDEICDEVMNTGLGKEETMEKLWGKRSKRPTALQPEAIEMGVSQASSQFNSLPDFLRGDSLEDLVRSIDRKVNCNSRKEVLNRCPGLLSVIVQGELAESRGLDPSHCEEFDRVYVDAEDVNSKTHPYRLGSLCMNRDLLELVKEAILELVPDGFYFTPTKNLGSDVSEIYRHISEQSDRLNIIFPKEGLDQWNGSLDSSEDDNKSTNRQLYYAMSLCNEFQHIRRTSRAVFTINDMQIIARASESLRGMLTDSNNDLRWAMLFSPSLFAHVVQCAKFMRIEDILDANVESRDYVIDCSSLNFDNENVYFEPRHPVELLKDGSFSGTEILAAFLDAFLTFFWIERSWISDIAVYDATLPQTVTMC